MSRRRRNRPRIRPLRNVQSTQAVDNSTTPATTTNNSTDEALPSYEPQAPPLEPSPTYFDTVPEVRIEKLPVETSSFSKDYDTLEIHCRTWQFETLVDAPPSPLLNFVGVVFNIVTYSNERQTLIAQLSWDIRELHVFRVARGDTHVLWRTGYRLVIPSRPWPESGLRSSNTNRFR